MIVAAAQCEARAGDLAHNVATAARLVREAGERGARVVLPEAHLSGYDASAFCSDLPTTNDLAGPLLDPLRAAAAAAGATVVGSTALRRDHGRTLASVVVEPDGTTTAPYDKQHLDGDEPTWFVPGEHPATITVDGVVLGLSICRDGSVPEHAATVAAAGASAYLASVAYFPGGARRLDVTYAARALDHGLHVVVAGLTGRCGTSTFIGGSAVYGPNAEALVRLGDEEGIALAEIR
ncbi:carbon-nitrogen hydrolase family protein [Nocardioides daeguensis]|uniref:CN hydrolase domain-containing protein n=1 Tax=Nocardioides daeguensis TaxID=908359 RepID=A0ABP6W3B9_9ACTN|nr:carbon-nitrogen hydrolase family protein [Nocardioides daeguensis]MBV6727677.1 carbon-nitrogen hydrolase family protein [Nocardioides daeguensis]MCR1775149.1 carbon-nitrogen hydrolase family protein [Nocardioides daeguensis]